MTRGCHVGQYWDTLVRNCMPCQMACEEPRRLPRCSEFCASLKCGAVPGRFYDRLLKQCLWCAQVCGHHPIECSMACQAQSAALNQTRWPADRPAVQVTTTGGSPGGEHHTVVIYSLLSLCLAVLICTLSMAVLVLWRRNRDQEPEATHGVPKHDQLANSGSSEDCLMEPRMVQGLEAMGEKISRPTETCVHCFPELRAAGRGGEKQRPPSPAPNMFYQQAVVTAPRWASTLLRPSDKDRGLRIICSPSQTST